MESIVYNIYFSMDNSLQTPEKNLYKCYNIYKKSEEVRYTLWFIFVKQ